jgi:hypothetical protein
MAKSVGKTFVPAAITFFIRRGMKPPNLLNLVFDQEESVRPTGPARDNIDHQASTKYKTAATYPVAAALI